MWEYKFVFKDDRVAGDILKVISNMDTIAGYSCSMREEVVYNDYYFDSRDLSLESRGMVCRIRHHVDDKPHYKLALKRQETGANREVIYLQSAPLQLSEGDFKNALQGRLPGNFGEVLQMFAGNGKLEWILQMRVFRKILAISNQKISEEIAYLNLDHTGAILPGADQVKAAGYEIELKSSRQSFPEAEVLRDYLQNMFSVIPVTRSKLRRLAPLLRQERPGNIPQKVILDMDTGVDDALALILAMNSPELDVLGITTVSGNVNAEQSVRNTAAVLSCIKNKTLARYPNLPPVAYSKLPVTGLPDASDVHGQDGLGGVCGKYIDPALKIEPDALELFKKTVQENAPGTITLITTGPLTNLAHWIEKIPDTVRKLRQVVSMGGVFFHCGNRSQAAEFNIHADPASARKVVEFCRKPVSSSHYEWYETLPLTFIGLDVTHHVRFYRDMPDQLSKNSPDDMYFRFIKEITNYYMDFYYRNEGLNGCYLHDPLAIGYVIDPSLCQAEQYHVEVEDQGEFTSGMTVADYRPTRIFKDKMKEVTRVCYKVDAKRFEDLFLERVLGII